MSIHASDLTQTFLYASAEFYTEPHECVQLMYNIHTRTHTQSIDLSINEVDLSKSKLGEGLNSSTDFLVSLSG